MQSHEAMCNQVSPMHVSDTLVWPLHSAAVPVPCLTVSVICAQAEWNVVVDHTPARGAVLLRRLGGIWPSHVGFSQTILLP